MEVGQVCIAFTRRVSVYNILFFKEYHPEVVCPPFLMMEIICQSQLDGADYLSGPDVSKIECSFLQKKRQPSEVVVKSLSLRRLRSLKNEGEQFWTKPGNCFIPIVSLRFVQINSYNNSVTQNFLWE